MDRVPCCVKGAVMPRVGYRLIERPPGGVPDEETFDRGCPFPVRRAGRHARASGLRHERPGERGQPARHPPGERPERTGARRRRIPTGRARGRRERARRYAAMLATGLDRARRLLVPARHVQPRCRADRGVLLVRQRADMGPADVPGVDGGELRPDGRAVHAGGRADPYRSELL